MSVRGLLIGGGLAAVLLTHGRAGGTLDIYFIDVEGGQSTLIVTPAGQSLLVDAGFPGDGAFQSTPGDPSRARDASRVVTAARAAGVSRIDDLLITHFHADHDGGVPELAQLLPIGTFVDHGAVASEADRTVRGSLAAFDAYARVRANGRHLEVAPGDRLPLEGVGAVVVSSAGAVLEAPLGAAGGANPACGAAAGAPQEPNENPRSTGVLVEYGKFRFLDLGDLTGQPLFDLVCPRNLIGPVDVYLVAHHGGPDAADPATFAAFRPRVAVVNNGPRKGGSPEVLAALHQLAGTDSWQLHRSEAKDAVNARDDRIANLDESTAHWIKISAQDDGSFELTNGRTGARTRYGAHH